MLFSRRLSLEVKLPLLMSAVLVTVLGISLLLTYTTLRSTALAAARERLTRASKQVASFGQNQFAQARARYVPVVTDSAVRRALRNAEVSPTAVTAALARAQMRSDSGMPVELWTADGRRVAFVGNDIRGSSLDARSRALPPWASVAGDPAAFQSDSTRLTPLYQVGNRIHFWLVTPVRDEGRTIGFVAHQRRTSVNSAMLTILRDLSGDSVSVYYRNVNGTFRASGTSGLVSPLQDVDSAAGTARADGELLLVHEERMGSTPLMLGLALPMRTVLAQPLVSLRRVLVLSAVLAIGGVLVAWIFGRSVARPLANITHAAGSLAEGNYDARVPTTGELEVRRLAETFNHMAAEMDASRAALERRTREAQAANNAKSEFLTTMSHELRTPLNAIGGYVELLEMGLRGPLSDAQRRDLQRIKTSQEHLLGLISSVLDLARIEAGQVHYDLVNVALDPFLAGMDALIAPQAAAQSVSLRYLRATPDLAAVADREKLRQILLNLLSNAIRHCGSDGVVTVSAEARGWQVSIIVDDNGPGIPEDKRDVIFEPFVQLDRSLTQLREGLGLGLAISRDLARGMLGDLLVEDREGPGARFVLLLPRGEADERASLLSGEMQVIRGEEVRSG